MRPAAVFGLVMVFGLAASNVEARSAAEEEDMEPRAVAPWAARLPSLVLHNVNGGATADFRLYADDGSIDEEAAREVDRLVADPRKSGPPREVDRRLLQLIVKAAAHFNAHDVLVVSTFRESKRKGSRHRTGEAMDFILQGVPSTKLAAELRTYARVGVGIYTHPRTGFVHLDVRADSFHWVDASPPGRTWREKGITDRGAVGRDLAYSPEQDLPDSALIPIEEKRTEWVTGRAFSRGGG
jgi:uncharacterized protein YcbK (DUF882 family)